MGKNVVRLNDPGTSVHASCLVPVPIASDSANEVNVYANSILISTDGDQTTPHGPHGGPICVPGPSFYSAGNVSESVFINGKGVARIEDPYDCGAIVTSGSPNVYVGK